MKSPWIDQKSLWASASSVASVGWDSPGSPWSSLLKSSLLTVCFRLRVGSRNSQSLHNNFAVPSVTGNMNSSPLCVTNTSFDLIFRGSISDASNLSKFSSSLIFATKIYPFQILAACNAHLENTTCRTFLPNWWRLHCFFVALRLYSTIAPNGITRLVNGSSNRLSHGVFPSARRSWTFRRQQ